MYQLEAYELQKEHKIITIFANIPHAKNAASANRYTKF